MKKEELVGSLIDKTVGEGESGRDRFWFAYLPEVKRNRLVNYYFVQDERVMHVEIYENKNGERSARISFKANSDSVQTLVIGGSQIISWVNRDKVPTYSFNDSNQIRVSGVGVIDYPNDLIGLPGVAEVLSQAELYYAIRPSTFVLHSVGIHEVWGNLAQVQRYEDAVDPGSGEFFMIASPLMEEGELFPGVARVLMTNSPKYVFRHPELMFKQYR